MCVISRTVPEGFVGQRTCKWSDFTDCESGEVVGIVSMSTREEQRHKHFEIFGMGEAD